MEQTLAERLLEAAEHLTGMIIVMIALTSLWGLTALIGRVAALFDKPATKPGAAAPAPVAVADGAVDDDLVIVAAAAATMLDAPHRVISVQPQASSWGQQGRRDIHASRRIR